MFSRRREVRRQRGRGRAPSGEGPARLIRRDLVRAVVAVAPVAVVLTAIGLPMFCHWGLFWKARGLRQHVRGVPRSQGVIGVTGAHRGSYGAIASPRVS